MRDKKPSGLPYKGETDSENKVWDALSGLPAEEPSADMKRSFYEKLDEASRPTLLQKLQGFLGFEGASAWVSASACLVLGLGAGLMLDRPADDTVRLLALEQNVAMLNRSLILDRLSSPAPDKRLQGIVDAAYVVQDDAEVAQALLARATGDRVASVRSAAIDALGPKISSPEIGAELMALLEDAESPLVQLALVDLVLRNGTPRQLDQLLELARAGRLHEELTQYVTESIGREVV